MEDDRTFVENEWHELCQSQIKRTFEYRLTKKWHHKQSDSWKSVWVLASCRHDLRRDGFRSIMGFNTDISLQKQAQEDAVERANLSEQLARSQKAANQLQIDSRLEAEEARKSMEKYMDITSHEMRNPLGAILQSADGIETSLLEFRASSKTAVISEELVDSNLEAVHIINVSHPVPDHGKLLLSLCFPVMCSASGSYN